MIMIMMVVNLISTYSVKINNRESERKKRLKNFELCDSYRKSNYGVN
jgi:hypothetical protein